MPQARRIAGHRIFWLCALGIICGVLALLGVRSSAAQDSGLPSFPTPGSQDRLLFPGSVETGQISAAQSSQHYLLLGNAGDQITVSMTRTDGDLIPRLVLSDLNGNVVAEQGADLAGRRAPLKATLKERGWYTLEATRDPGTTSGGYRLDASGFTPAIYTVLPAGAPPDGASASVVLRQVQLPLAKADQTMFLVALNGGQILQVSIQGQGDYQITVSAADKSNPTTQQGTGTVTVTYPVQQAAWALVSIKTGAPATLMIQAVDQAGTVTALAPDVLTDFATVTPTLTPTTTDTPTATFTPLPTLTPTPTFTPRPQVTCPGALPSRLLPGDTARVTLGGLPNRLRQGAGVNYTIITVMPSGEQFRVLAGPQCASNNAWYQVEWQGITGWTIESGQGEYYVEPVNTGSQPSAAVLCPGFLPSIIRVGQTARIVPAQQGGNVLNAVAGKLSETSDNRRLATIPEGATVQVLSGPTCINGIPWWQVQYGSKVGWTPEGEGNTYWMMPVN